MASPDLASKAVKTIQGIELDGHRINLKISKKEEEKLNNRQEAKNQDQPEGSSKIMVRNVPFQCQGKEKTQLHFIFICFYPQSLSSRTGAAVFDLWRVEIRSNAEEPDWQASWFCLCRIQTGSGREFRLYGVETVDAYLWKVRGCDFRGLGVTPPTWLVGLGV